MKKALIVTALARFTKSFLTNDIMTLQNMGYEVHCAANIHHAGAECMPEYFKEKNVTFHQIDFSSSKPLSMETFKSYKEMAELFKSDKFDDTVVDRESYREALGIQQDQILVLAVGELSHRKNHQIIIKALAKAQIPQAVFMICGNAMTDANTKEELELLAKENGVNLRLMGLRDDIPQICKCADIGVMPSIREGLGLSGIEMLASGLPVIASNVHGIVDYITEGVDGDVCDPFDEVEFAIAIKKLLNPEQRKAMAENCPKAAEPFDVAHSRKAMQEIYRELLV